jgi:hypothetical protein
MSGTLHPFDLNQSSPSLTHINAAAAAARNLVGGAWISSMNEQFQAVPVTWANARAAFPLVRLHDAGITLEKWLLYVRRRSRATSGRSGLMAISDRRGIVHALFSYHVGLDLRTRKRLCIEALIVAHMPGSQIDEAVDLSTGQVAASLNCQTISIEQSLPGFGIREQRPPMSFKTAPPSISSTRQH